MWESSSAGRGREVGGVLVPDPEVEEEGWKFRREAGRGFLSWKEEEGRLRFSAELLVEEYAE